MLRAPGLFVLFALALTTLPAPAAPRTPADTPAEVVQPTLPAPPVVALNRDFLGISVRDPWYEFNTNPDFPNAPNEAFQAEMGANLEQAGVGWVRLEFHIPYDAGVADPCNANCQWEIAKNDYFINVVAPQRNLKVLALLGFGLLRNNDPCILNKNPTETSPRFGGGVNPAIVAWLTRALAIADRYSDRIAAYEVLNEQNRIGQCGTPATFAGKQINAIAPTITGRMITKLYRFCHAMDLPADEPAHGCAAAKIILGGLHPRGSSAPGSSKTSLFDTQYLTAIYTDTASFATFRNNPDHEYYPVDGIGYHPYPEEISLSPNNVEVDRGINRMRQALQHIDNQGASDACRQFWVTEVGYNVGFDPDGPKNPRLPQTEEGQAALLNDVYISMSQRRLDQQLCGGGPEIANVFWFKYEDFPPAEIIYDDKGNPKEYPQKWGIVRIPILSDGVCQGGCYEPSGVPELYRQSFAVYRALSGYRTYLPAMSR
jgi:hypothetical protein